LARQQRLQAVLRDMAASGRSLEPAPLQGLRAILASASAPDLEAGIEAIIADELVEEALELLRSSRREAQDRALIEALAARLVPLAHKMQQRRSALWQLDTRRVLIRTIYEKKDEALGFDDGDLHAIFLLAFRLEGLPLALDLGKRPRPLLSLGLPLPAGVGGQAESMDVVLKKEPDDAATTVMARLNQRLPAGLKVQHWQLLPNHASGVNELALLSHWRWEVPSELRAQTGRNVTAFLEAASWPWDRGVGKTDGSLDLRRLIPELHWEEGVLRFTTRMGDYQAVNPLKLLGAIFDLESTSIEGLVRTSVDLKTDARLGQGERFEPKLKNMYEDAVLLGGGSNIILVDEDDDEPIQLG
jgi:radical SAM-linked protein